MSDIDFDELDKAVNNLMGNVKEPKEDDTPKAKTLEVKDTLKPGEEPLYDKLGEAAQKIGNEALESEREQTLVEHFVPKKMGEDLAYDKLNEVASRIGSETLNSNGEVPAPVTDKPQPSPPVEQAADTAVPSATLAPTVAPKPAAAQRTTGAGRVMDIVHPSSDGRTATMPSSKISIPQRTMMASSAPQPSTTQSTVASQHADDQVPVTPFLPNAKDKVEKRPLGAVPSPFTDESKEEKKVDSESPVVELQPINSETTEHPDEKLAKDDQQVIDAAAIVAEPTAEEQELQKIEAKEVVSETPEVHGEEMTIESVESGDTESLRNGATKDTHGTDPSGGAIYDVNEYHKPIGHTKKQKSGWGKVIVIVLIIVVFASAAGAAYFWLAA